MSRDYVALAAQYQADVLSGAIPACKWVRLACERNRRDLDRQGTDAFPYRFDPEKASRICQMAELLPHIKGPKAKIIGKDEQGRNLWNPIVLEPWQCWIFCTMFGWLRLDTGLRRFRVGLILIPRKNSKSTMAAIVALYMLVADGEGGPEVYCLHESTRILTAEFEWKPLKDVRLGDELIGFDEETPGHRKYRKLRRASVTDYSHVSLESYLITFEDGRTVTASADHLWLGQTTRKAKRVGWMKTRDLKPGACIRDLGRPWSEDYSKAAGYLAGVFDGEACFHTLKRQVNGDPGDGDGFRIAFSQRPGLVMDQVHELCESLGYGPSRLRKHKSGVDTFEIGGFYNCARFLGEVRPTRLLDGAMTWCEGRTPNKTSHVTPVRSVQFLGTTTFVAIGTSTKTLFAEGFFSHNSAATTRDQARVVAEIVWEMAKRSPAFCEYFGVRIGSETTKSLAVPGSAGKFMPLSADANSLDGLNVSCAIVDELHAVIAAVWQVLDTGTGARLQPWLLGITTAGVDVAGICHQKLGYLEKILDGVTQDETFFGTNYTIDQGDDIRQLVIQRKANPNWGVSVQPDDLQRKVTEAHVNQAELNNVLTKHFNVWIRSESAWMTATTWQTCANPLLTLEYLRAFPLWIGVDLGETRDPSSLALLFKLGPESFAFIPKIYLPADVIARSPTAEMPGWVRQGHLIETPGNEADYRRIQDDLLEYVKTFKVQEIDFDRRSARLMMQEIRLQLEPTLGRDKVEKFVLDIPQNLDTFDPAMKTVEAWVSGKKIQHDGNPMMAWMVSNIAVERDWKGQIYPRKAGGKDSANKIDGAIALFTATSRAMLQQEAAPSYRLLVLGGTR